MRSLRKRRRRSGAILVLTAVMMVAMFALLVVAVDVGYVALVRTQLQSSADAAALAAPWELYDSRTLTTPLASPELVQADVLTPARYYASENPVGQVQPELADADIELGRLDVTAGPNAQLYTPDAFGDLTYNAVRVSVHRTADINGEIPSFFARVVGVDSSSGGAEATAAFVDNLSGFGPLPPGKNLMILPFAMDKQTWDALMDGNAGDDWTWDADQGITSGSDGVLEVNLFPQGANSPGNRGTVDIGANNNSTADLARQIVEGVNTTDLDHIGGKLELGPDGTLELNGDTGISAGMKDELASIRGQPRIIPLFDSVSGNGNNATYTIVGFAGVRVIDVRLTGKMSGKRVIVQPARVQVYGGIPASGSTPISNFIYSPVRLVR